MNDATKLIERMEKETGQRYEDNDGDNFAVTGLLGVLARSMGMTPDTYTEREDVAAGILIRHQMSPQYKREQEAIETFATLVSNGMSPEDAKGLFG